jgi:hypothetical protein
MKPHPRIRKTIKWGGAAVTMLLVVVWIGSRWRYVRWDASRWSVCLVGGGIDVLIDTDRPKLKDDPWQGVVLGWRAGLLSEAAIGLHWTVLLSAGPPQLFAPLWIPCTAAFVITGFAWRLDSLAGRRERAARLNLCPKCNYNRAGLTAGMKCPECGTAPDATA